MELARTNEGAFCYTRHTDGSVDGKSSVFPAGSDTGIQGLAATNDSTMLLFTDGEQNQVRATVISSSQNVKTYSSGGSFSNGIAVSSGEHVSTREIGVVLPDPTDLPFLEVAVLGSAEALITDNLRHFKPRMGRYNMNVCPPNEFVKKWRQHSRLE
jgi:hypothetical protein